MKSPLYETAAEAAPVTCRGVTEVVLLPETPEEAATPEATVVGFAEPALVILLTPPGAVDADLDTPAAEDTATEPEVVTGTCDVVSTVAGADEASTEETGIGIIGEALFAGDVGAVEPASETGQTVVYKGIVSVTTAVDLAGQFMTVGAQDVVVYVFVV
jgi:hypothetical protein